ncbi:YafY family transcriptional regulator [Streptomyces verrucosisporus]|uniref:helix-turn-helix transcriptional regulator n=1 Tax=Streptomyces verrucosisporus TaxID=1695161 RepID=UPI0019D2B1AC|nr:YafY family protein [Streptomyces verrucosisporus]MBN3930202.1 YafY family transcriptional regulator [Streptomyces verrucosisporus]
MMETSARLLRLLSLLQAHREWSGAELAERLRVTSRTVRRDVERLRTLGYPVHSTTGTAGGYRLGAGAELPPLLLDDDEAVAVAVGLRTAAHNAVQGMEESSVRALAKLEQVLPDRLRRRVSALAAFTDPLGGRRGPAVDVETITELVNACRDRRQLRFTYRGHDGSGSRRTVDPYRLVCSSHRWYLVGWDAGRADWRTFRVDRLALTPPHGPRFTPRRPPAGDWAAYVSEGISTAAYPQRATVLLHAPADLVAERIAPTAGVLEPVDGRTCLLRTGAPSLDEMALHILMLGFDFEVREPAGLGERIEELADRLGRAARAWRTDGEELRAGLSGP